MYCSEFEITFMYVNLELVELHFIRILIIYTYIVRVAKQNLFFFFKLYQFVQKVNLIPV